MYYIVQLAISSHIQRGILGQLGYTVPTWIHIATCRAPRALCLACPVVVYAEPLRGERHGHTPRWLQPFDSPMLVAVRPVEL